MSNRILTKATAVGTLVLGAVALSGCASKGGTGTTAGGSQSATVVSGSSAGASASSAAGAATGTGASGGTSTQTAVAGGVSSCTGSHISVKINQGSSGMGHTGSVLVFTNTGSSACTMYGYPGADVTDGGQYNFASRMNATRVSGVAVKTVTLSPGSSASAMLEWDVNPTDGEPASAANCPGQAGGYLEITPPNTIATIKSEPPLDMCAALKVYPVVAGTAGQ
jgi:hypothetical protein